MIIFRSKTRESEEKQLGTETRTEKKKLAQLPKEQHKTLAKNEKNGAISYQSNERQEIINCYNILLKISCLIK